MFKNRAEAGRELAKKLLKYRSVANGVVLGLPRGGVVVAKEVADFLDLPLGILVTRKIGAPGNPEYAIGAVSESKLILDEVIDAQDPEIKKIILREREEIERRKKEFAADHEITGKTVILVDDGLATGKTMEVAIGEVKKKAAKVIVAVPVAPPSVLEQIKPLVDKLMILSIEPTFFAVGQFYQDFPQTSDKEVKKILSSNYENLERGRTKSW